MPIAESTIRALTIPPLGEGDDWVQTPYGAAKLQPDGAVSLVFRMEDGKFSAAHIVGGAVRMTACRTSQRGLAALYVDMAYETAPAVA